MKRPNFNFLALGKNIKDLFYFLGSLFHLGLENIFWIFHAPLKKNIILEQIEKTVIKSLPIVSLISLFIGIILALQTAVQMQRLGSEMYIASIVALSVVRELGPVITALIVAGRSGAAITAEIGSMLVTEQIDALKSLAVNPVHYLVVPRFLALSFMLPVLTLYANIIGIIGGYLICVYKLSISSTMYINITFEALRFKDLFSGLIKALFFGMIIALVSCLEGFRVEGGAEGVGKATRNSVVASFILIITADCIFTAIFYFVFP
ncbi:MAG: ABC transporter permease [Candidatus Omnitrophica bacterium]|nr:ABC transporter permease [Candidatus Omnitrophota bacterium]MCM8799261.1 ABC transporter permease [Candidatus Omnitrophota bacterium]